MDDLNCSMYKRLVILKWSYGGHHFVKNVLTNILVAMIIFTLWVSVRNDETNVVVYMYV
jgi:hypothetical protein